MAGIKRRAGCPYAPRQGIVLALSGLFFVLGTGPLTALDRGADGKFSKRDSSHFVLFQDVDIDESAGLRGSRRFEQDVLEAFQHVAVYAGVPRANQALKIAKETYAEMERSGQKLTATGG